MPNDIITEIKKNTRRRFSAEEKIRIVMEGIRGETPTTQLRRCLNISNVIEMLFKLEKEIGVFVKLHNIKQYHKALGNVTPNNYIIVREN